MVVEYPWAAGDAPAQGTTHMVGVDEAGRGPVIGPLTVAAIAVPLEGGEDRLRELGVRDSKKLAPARREELAAILDADYVHWTIEVSAEDIDALRSTATLNVIEARIFASAILGVVAQLGEGAIVTAYLDAADASETTFERYVRGAMAGSPGAGAVVGMVCRHGADDAFPVVSAASVLAKSRREEAVARIQAEVGKDFGSGYPGDPNTVAFLEKWISEKGVLPPHTRASWRTAQRLLDRHGSQVRTLDEF